MIMAVFINALLTLYFLRRFGMIGAAYAPVIAWAVTLPVSIVVALRLNRRIFK
jgi:Na+-driven multidrug efflux pump